MTISVPTMEQLKDALRLPVEIPQYEPKNNNNLRHQAMMRWQMQSPSGEGVKFKRQTCRSKWDREG